MTHTDFFENQSCFAFSPLFKKNFSCKLTRKGKSKSGRVPCFLENMASCNMFFTEKDAAIFSAVVNVVFKLVLSKLLVMFYNDDLMIDTPLPPLYSVLKTHIGFDAIRTLKRE